MGSYYKKLKKMARFNKLLEVPMPSEKHVLDFTPKLTTISPEERAKQRSGVYSYII